MNIFQLHAEIKGTERIERWEYPNRFKWKTGTYKPVTVI